MLGGLTSVKLKKTAASPSRKPVKVRPPRCNNSEEFYQLMGEANMEEYYESIEKFTFPSIFSELTVAGAQAIIKVFNAIHSIENPEERKYYDWSANEELKKLEAEIDSSHKKLGCEYLFIRTSSRSPKDAALSERFQFIYDEFLELLNKGARDDVDTEENRKLHALYHMGTKALRCRNGSDAINLLVRSERLQDDLQHYIEKPSLYQLCVREFTDFDVELEFRGFVWDNTLTAITQYNEFCYFPEMVRHRDVLAKVITDFTNTHLIGKISLEAFVIDFIVISTAGVGASEKEKYSIDKLEVKVVEVNPFAEFAGAGLFKWELAQDANILYGDAPFELRVAEKPLSDAIKLIGGDWTRFIENSH